MTDKNLEAVQHLIEVIAKLRSPNGGCPWDLEQTPETLIPYILEEAYEVVDAIRSGDRAAIAEELGDLLMQVVLQSQIASETNQFSLAEVAEGIAQKLIRRHPHVFADVKVDSMEQIHQNWELIKAQEKGEDPNKTPRLSDKLRRYSRSLPALSAGMKISQKAAQTGFEWETVEGVWVKFDEELAEFKQALQNESKDNQESELGDLLFTLINVARWHGLDPDAALRSTNRKFIQRLAIMESLADESLENYAVEQLEVLWQQAKAKLNNEGNGNSIAP
ncbi:nucleoside triphosphate pyrophosphohydrolase [Tumidithrix elongata RA019]|uniref:Nucleoside triphosphate pyrophosphohydrolase n=1 Tax=Tumidithrix elongata BACA0141 TaxID=2716417 RepID=A0AAW9Q325_9CYAN|nr:nucleoside triphosphate pyrophosphohydrolase [Tumidithrix elongata RA019]